MSPPPPPLYLIPSHFPSGLTMTEWCQVVFGFQAPGTGSYLPAPSVTWLVIVTTVCPVLPTSSWWMFSGEVMTQPRLLGNHSVPEIVRGGGGGDLSDRSNSFYLIQTMEGVPRSHHITRGRGHVTL